MSILLDKIVAFIICMALYIGTAVADSGSINDISNRLGDGHFLIVPILVAVIFSAFLSFIDDDRYKIIAFVVYLLMCFYSPVFLFFTPLICYDIINIKENWLWLLIFAPIVADFVQNLNLYDIFIVLFVLIVYLLKYRTNKYLKLKEDHFELRDTSKEMSMALRKNNEALIHNQDYEINIATLNERNRIARDIHDNVGHMLSSSMLQIGAIIATNNDDKLTGNLNIVKDTLSSAMDSIRSSVHNLYEESIDLYIEVKKLVDNFEFCSIKLDYDIETNMNVSLKYCYIYIIKEALSNVMKHSDATEVSITMREHPAIFQLVIQDNGTVVPKDDHLNDGIGLKNISNRVSSFNGLFNLSFDNGCRIFISIPKS